MKAAILTNEFPPNIYGGAGTHVDFLTRELIKHIPVDVFCFGNQDYRDQNGKFPLTVKGFDCKDKLYGAHGKLEKVFSTLENDLKFAAALQDCDIVHCHTWYSHWAGLLCKILYKLPLILTTHSLEPHRPWKFEQLGTGYDLSTWIENTAYVNADGVIAVSADMEKDVIQMYNVDPARIRVIHNGIDLNFYQRIYKQDVLREYGIDPDKPFVLFVGRITRQKGIFHLIKTIPYIDESAQIVLCAGAPDTPEIKEEVQYEISRMQQSRKNVIWISQMLDHHILRVLYSHAAVFVCPSLYEPFGIINLEAMACHTPVVGTYVGGIPEIIKDGETGFLVSFAAESKINFEPKYPEIFQRDMAEKINLLIRNPQLRKHMGEAARKRVEAEFSWEKIALKTIEFYQFVISRKKEREKQSNE
ncbi:MAG: glycogen synthase [Fibrobacter sp.]|jgi:starch synthase|nr:glycogen synthase [Fibrobacter sp.]